MYGQPAQVSKSAITDIICEPRKSSNGFYLGSLVCGHTSHDGNVCTSSVVFGHACNSGHLWDDQDRYHRMQVHALAIMCIP